ncbi:hypothetical protein [Streptomyces sp. M2CJ-2]|nr:hypothetical protein [Streptomyces sp. M2CJ-2]
MRSDSRIMTAARGADGPEAGVQGPGCTGLSFADGPVDAEPA